METATQTEQAISALRGAYAAFNRNDIAAAVEPLDPSDRMDGTSRVPRRRHVSRTPWSDGLSDAVTSRLGGS